MNRNINELPTDYQNFIALSRYARWLSEENRREEWSETVNRYLQYMVTHVSKKHKLDLSLDLQDKIYKSIIKHISNLTLHSVINSMLSKNI